ncbi:hypothetical protein PV04_03073 [Phialophora macrospora]|uniref:Uncharacterized protein n=1 Tax=Phialophora macrospora TaxID=1851006 RepID=A0A0D2FWH4_9EURO|nr:hypothetical protein PV04_03073 [Phialophora macrospora]
MASDPPPPPPVKVVDEATTPSRVIYLPANYWYCCQCDGDQENPQLWKIFPKCIPCEHTRCARCVPTYIGSKKKKRKE